MNWTSAFDEVQCHLGIPSVFTCNHEGELQLDVKRTRDFHKHNPHWLLSINKNVEQRHTTKNVQQHLIAIDKATYIPQYIIVSTELYCEHPRFQFVSCLDFEQAQIALQQYKEDAFSQHKERRLHDQT